MHGPDCRLCLLRQNPLTRFVDDGQLPIDNNWCRFTFNMSLLNFQLALTLNPPMKLNFAVTALILVTATVAGTSAFASTAPFTGFSREQV